MIFFRLENGKLINIAQITEIKTPKDGVHTWKDYSVRMADGKSYTLFNSEAERLMQIITIYSVIPPVREVEK